MNSFILFILSGALLTSCGKEQTESKPETNEEQVFSNDSECSPENRKNVKKFLQKFQPLTPFDTNQSVDLTNEKIIAISFTNSGGFSGTDLLTDLETGQQLQSSFLDYNGYCNNQSFRKGKLSQTTKEESDQILENVLNLKLKSFDDLDLAECEDETLSFPLDLIYVYLDQNRYVSVVDYSNSTCKNSEHNNGAYNYFVD